MSKTLRFVASAVAFAVVFVTTGNVTLAAAAASLVQVGANVLFGQILPKPETTEGAIKTSIPPRVSAYGRSRLYGAYILFETASNGTAIDVYAIHDGQIDGIERRYLGDDPVTVAGGTVSTGADKRYQAGAVKWYERLGSSVSSAFSQVTAIFPAWSAQHRGDGVVTVATLWKSVKADKFQETYPQSGPTAVSIAARWQRVFDWRDPAQNVADPTTWTWSENAALHLAHYRLVREKAYREPGAILPDADALAAAWATFFAPTLASWTEAANVCDEQITLKAGGTEPRYRSCFSHKHTDPHKDVITALTACFDGWTSPRADGALVVYAGKYYEPTISIGPAEIVSYNWEYGVDDESSVNELTLSYVSSAHEYTTVECDPWVNEDDILARGAVRSQPFAAAVPSHGQARRLAKRGMSRIMAAERGTITTNVAGRVVRGQRYINLRIEDAGAVFFDGVAEITALTRNLTTGGVTFSWLAADPNVDAWSPVTEEGEPAANGSRQAPAPLEAPTVTEAVTVYADATNEGTGGRISVTVDGPDRDDLTWFVRWRVQGAAIWNEQRYSDVDPGPAVELITGFVPIGETLEVEAAYQVGDGRVSDYSSPPTLVNSDTQTTPPEAATAITLVQWVDSIDLTTDGIGRASSYRWRFYAADGTTLIRTLVTTGRTVSYGKALAANDGARRSYVVDVAGVNSAGTGATASSGVISKPAPAQVQDVVAADDATTANVSFTLLPPGQAAGYVLYYSTTAAFDPLEQGFKVPSFGSPIYAYGLAAATYYAKVAAYDDWSDRPDLLNFSAEDSFVISVGGGDAGGGSGTGGGGGGYCVADDTPIAMADGTQKRAGDLVAGDLLWTQHEQTLEWGAFPVEAVELVPSSDVWEALGLRATGGHRVWLNGGWVRMRDIGQPTDATTVARITVADAHTYYSSGVLSHNVKQFEQIVEP